MNKSGCAMRLKIGAGIPSLALALAWACVPVAAQAQSQDTAAAADDADPSDIVVTGTLLRGAPPVGSNPISLGQQRIEEVGAISTNELLSTIPQISNFFNEVPIANLSIAVNQIQTVRPSIRDIGSQVQTTSPTLVIVNGHRIASVGVTQSSVDPDMIPTGAIGQVDVNTEGGSATYGADAVAGVINFVTLRRFNGVKVDGSYGFADDYKQWNGNVTAGKDWGTGSAYVSYSYSRSSAIFGRDRDYIRDVDYSSVPYQPRNFTCATPNLTLSTLLVNGIGGPIIANFGDVPYASPNFVQGSANRCDNSENATVVPKSERHGAFVSLTQDLGDHTKIDAHGFYGQRFTEARSEAVGIVGLGASNPAAASLPTGLVVGPTCVPGLGCTFFGFPFENRALVNFSFSPVLGNSPLTQTTKLVEYGGDLEVTHDITDNWQIRGLANWSQSNSKFNLQSVNVTRLNAAGNGSTAATAINPLNISQTNRALIDDLIDNENAGQVRDRLFQGRVIVDGTLFTLPGGDVKLAVGYEFLGEKLRSRQGVDIRRGTLGSVAYRPISRDVHSVFGELQVPIFSEQNEIPGIHSLILSAAGRYDHYSDFGKTVNPKFGFAYEPVKGFRLRGNWGTSFTAPNLLDLLGGFQQIGVAQTHPFQPQGQPAPANSYDVVIQGTNLPLKPQSATTWSVGADLEPTDGLKISGSYYHVKFKDIISIPTPDAGIFTDFATTNFLFPTAAQVRAFASQIPGGLAQVEPLLANGATFYSLIDFRVGNYGIYKLSGVDFQVDYRRDTSFGSFDLGVNGNLHLTRENQVSPLVAAKDQIKFAESTPFTLQGRAGVNVGPFRGQVTVNYNGGYSVEANPTNAAAGVPIQTSVKSFTTTNLFLKYDVPADAGMLQNLSFTVNVNNVFDTVPPILLRNRSGDRGYTNGSTLGRTFIFGAKKLF